MSSTANTKTYKVYMGDGTGSVGGAFTAGTSTAFVSTTGTVSIAGCGIRFVIGNRTAATNVGGSIAVRGVGANSAAVTGTINTALEQKIIVTVQKGVGTDTITLESIKLELAR
jgi:hypothetical protein